MLLLLLLLVVVYTVALYCTVAVKYD